MQGRTDETIGALVRRAVAAGAVAAFAVLAGEVGAAFADDKGSQSIPVLPEINDEVLVVFEHGDISGPYGTVSSRVGVETDAGLSLAADGEAQDCCSALPVPSMGATDGTAELEAQMSTDVSESDKLGRIKVKFS